MAAKEIWTSWSLFILIVLLIIALFTSYFLQARRIQAVHETVISIFAGTLHSQDTGRARITRTCAETKNRNACWPRATINGCRLCAWAGQLRLPVLLQRPTSTYHPRIWLRATSGTRLQCNVLARADAPQLGQLLPQHRHHSHLCLPWHVHFRHRPRPNPLCFRLTTH